MSATATAPANGVHAPTAGVDPFEMSATSSGNYVVCPPGNYPGWLIGIIDLGTHSEDFKDDGTGTTTTKDVRKAALIFELSGENQADGTPYTLAKQVNLSLNEKATLRKLIKDWRGRDLQEGESFNIRVMLDKAALLNVVNKKTSKNKDVAEIGSIGQLPRGMTAPTRHNDLILYTVADGTPPDLDWLPRLFGEEIKEVVNRSHERKAQMKAAAAATGQPENDCPF